MQAPFPPLPALHHAISGPPDGAWLTFIPGIGNDAGFWQRQAEALSDTFRVLTFDPWGHANSPAPPVPCSFQRIQQGILQLWDTVGISRSHVVGLGFGGSVALSLAIDAPQRLHKVVACCCRPRQPDDRHDFWRQRILAAEADFPALADATVDRWLSPAFRASHPDLDLELRAMVKRTSPAGYRAYVEAFIEMDFERDVDRIKTPTLLVAAEHDHGGGPVASMQALQQRIPGARLHVLTGSGHICNYERPMEVTQLVRGFLS